MILNLKSCKMCPDSKGLGKNTKNTEIKLDWFIPIKIFKKILDLKK